jgi:hypothetical protein
MATAEEIARRVTESDNARSATRSERAREVGELFGRYEVAAEALRTIEDQLGVKVGIAHEVMTIDELEQFTDAPVADLTRWLEGGKTSRTKRKRSTAGGSGAKSETGRGPSVTSMPTARPVSALPERAVPRADAVDARVPAQTP